ncbi:MAG: hypothetical protein HY583_02745 [Candidatus Omnitrophica bacterium]|nr:hypothetical protein [Candidatus Omnitrophota bacterium]
MKAFFVGVLVLLLVSLLSLAGILLFPLLLLLGFFLRLILALALILFSIWLVGKITLLLIEFLSKKK